MYSLSMADPYFFLQFKSSLKRILYNSAQTNESDDLINSN